jgi:DNA repair photolyase
MKAKTGTREWSASSVNCMIGCENDCLYCYAKQQAIRFGRATPESWSKPRPNLEVVGKRFGKRRGRVMFPTTHDITLENLPHCKMVIRSLLRAGNQVLIVSKPNPLVIELLCNLLMLAYVNSDHDPREQVLFRFTIGSSDSETLQFWEPHAPTYEQRLYALMWAHRHGWQTSVSMEPLLDVHPRRVRALVRAVDPYVTDTIWLGTMNHGRARVTMNMGGMRDGVLMKIRELEVGEKFLHALVSSLGDNPKLRWKDSIQKALGMKGPEGNR